MSSTKFFFRIMKKRNRFEMKLIFNGEASEVECWRVNHVLDTAPNRSGHLSVSFRSFHSLFFNIRFISAFTFINFIIYAHFLALAS